MKRKFVVTALLCLALVAMMALAAAPMASAKAQFAKVSAIETYAALPNPTTPEPWLTGGVAHWTFNNVLREESSSWLMAGYNYTHMVVLFDPQTGAGRCHGTVQIVLDDANGIWKGAFFGSISLADGTYDIRVAGRGVSGAVAGMVFVARDVNSNGASGTVSATIVAPHGF